MAIDPSELPGQDQSSLTDQVNRDLEAMSVSLIDPEDFLDDEELSPIEELFDANNDWLLDLDDRLEKFEDLNDSFWARLKWLLFGG